MESNREIDHRETRMKRKEMLEKKKSIDEIMRTASLEKDCLSHFQHFRHYQRNGLCVHLESGHGDKLPSHTKKYIQNLLKLNMEAPYGREWPAEEKVKRREMVASEARYIFVHEIPNEDAIEQSELLHTERKFACYPIVGFVHYRFVLEEEVPVLYIYELQLEPRIQGKGLGKFLMELIELIACKNRMGAVVLTVQKANVLAMDFYLHKLKYTVSAMSPSRVDPLLGPEKSYEILCKAFNHEAGVVLEVSKLNEMNGGKSPNSRCRFSSG